MDYIIKKNNNDIKRNFLEVKKYLKYKLKNWHQTTLKPLKTQFIYW